MQISKLSSFTAYELTEQESLQGYTFNEANRAVIQNLISVAAEEFLAVGLRGEGTELILSLDEKLRVAELRGGINQLKYLLETGEVIREQIEQTQKLAQQNQNDSSL
ncbi:hypothetical protein D3C87_725660 [compost metagenome]